MNTVFTEELIEKIETTKVIAVVIIEDEKYAVPLANALLEGGINIIELTLRTPAALGALKQIKENVPAMTCGIGTILTTEQVDQVVAAGASFGVAPGMNPKVVAYAKSKGLAFAPGIATPSDIEAALECNCRILKYFPAETSGGLKNLQNISAPYKHLGLKFIPLGGLKRDNTSSYLESPQVLAVGGSWIAKQDVIKAQSWEIITQNSKATVEIVKAIKK